ncbi:hypothetical protein DFA_04203 [Cavenderia fasciculata]|uniref:Uncharacterized protein n=1 Tax=Cavenderia fasciculata TaxID=261658 RepID=F4Q1K6_CACFS|nr:uncharacterized protein DFA_04203 [Cavenderia fasciculata]EGG18707.1 hypothetical protein DFA_04203 [Cavenderia fasciculata]|eukprot:XP_004366611.1 hypothetical protein DFA_04203 [Cavenderia fasciculata]
MKLIILANLLVVLVFLVGTINGQSSSLPVMIFDQQPDLSIQYLEIDLYSGIVFKKVSVPNPDGSKLLKWVRAVYPYVAFFTSNNNGTLFQIHSLNINTNVLENTYNSTTSFLYPPILSDQPFGYFWGQTMTAYFPGLAGNGFETTSLLPYSFNTQYPSNSPIMLGPAQLNDTAQFNSIPISAFDGVDYFYVLFSIGDLTGISTYSLQGSTSKQVILNIPGRSIQGTEQLFMLYGQLYYCVLENGVGITVSIMNLVNGEVEIIYKDLNPGYQSTFQPFVLNKITGTITILVQTPDDKILVTVLSYNQSTKQYTIDNVIPTNSSFIIPSI